MQFASISLIVGSYEKNNSYVLYLRRLGFQFVVLEKNGWGGDSR